MTSQLLIATSGVYPNLRFDLDTDLVSVAMIGLVPYKGIAQAMIDAIANEIQISFAVLPVGKPRLDTGRLRAFGVTTEKRAPGMPEVSAISDFGPGYASFGWYSVVAPGANCCQTGHLARICNDRWTRFPPLLCRK